MEESSFYREGMVGVSLAGDIRMRSFISQGARRVGPTFHVDKVLLVEGGSSLGATHERTLLDTGSVYSVRNTCDGVDAAYRWGVQSVHACLVLACYFLVRRQATGYVLCV